jgi:hypothetical protein
MVPQPVERSLSEFGIEEHWSGVDHQEAAGTIVSSRLLQEIKTQ